MGTLSNSGINRWGLNLFWYRYWYDDKNSQINIQQDNIFNELIYTYLFYGIFHPKNIFMNRYWSKSMYDKFHVSELLINHNERYFYYQKSKNLENEDNVIQKCRFLIKQIFFSKIWILRYQKWIIMNFYAFQSLKRLEKSISKRNKSNTLIAMDESSLSNLIISKKIRFIFNLFLINFKNKLNFFYKF